MFDVVRISDERSDTAPCGEVRRAQFRSTADRSAAYCSTAERSDLFGRLSSTVKKSNAVQPLSALLQEDPMSFSTAFCSAAESVVRRHPFGRPGQTLCHVRGGSSAFRSLSALLGRYLHVVRPLLLNCKRS